MRTVVRIGPQAQQNGSHDIELDDGTLARIPADKVPLIIQTLQVALAQRVFAQSQRLDVPTESTLPLVVLRLLDANSASLGLETNLACNLRELGWTSLTAEDDVLRRLKTAIDRVLLDRSGPSRMT